MSQFSDFSDMSSLSGFSSSSSDMDLSEGDGFGMAVMYWLDIIHSNIEPDFSQQYISDLDLTRLNAASPDTGFPAQITTNNLEEFHAFLHFCCDRFLGIMLPTPQAS